MAHFASTAKYSDVLFICVYGKDVNKKNLKNTTDNERKQIHSNNFDKILYQSLRLYSAKDINLFYLWSGINKGCSLVRTSGSALKMFTMNVWS